MFFIRLGDVAQLVEHLLCKQGVGGSSPLVSTFPVRGPFPRSRSTFPGSTTYRQPLTDGGGERIDTRTAAEVGTIRRLAESFEIALRARNLSDRTVEG